MKLHGMVVEQHNPVWDFHWLCTMMKKRNRVSIKGHQGLINGISPEDGSGNNWLVTIVNEFGNHRIFIKAS